MKVLTELLACQQEAGSGRHPRNPLEIYGFDKR